jgi:fructose-bisphosphate aldolase class I
MRAAESRKIHAELLTGCCYAMRCWLDPTGSRRAYSKPDAFWLEVTIMTNEKMMTQISRQGGFIAALDQRGGSTPGALRLYGIRGNAYSGDAEMFGLMHQMRVRIMTAPAFTGAKIIAAILFEGTMDGQVRGKRVPAFLWEERGVIPFLKVDKGLETEHDGVSLMKPMAGLDALLTRAVKLGIFGTKMRSVINLPSKDGIAAVVAQQFDVAAQIAEHGLMPIIEPEVSIKSPDKAGAEAILLAELTKKLDAVPDGRQVMLKLTIPDVADFYSALMNHKRVARVVALSGGYMRADACKRLSANHGMIASFSRALVEDLRHSMSDAAFGATLAKSIDEIYRASTVKI